VKATVVTITREGWNPDGSDHRECFVLGSGEKHVFTLVSCKLDTDRFLIEVKAGETNEG
jgi:hypothetical protein